jgi:hypothetical protein
MFSPLARFFHLRPDPSEIEHAFVRDVKVKLPRESRSRRSELVLAMGWVLVLTKSLVVHWACHAYSVPFNPWWLIGPTVVFAALCTWLYWRRD